MKWTLADVGEGYFITSDNPVVCWVDPQTCHPIYGDHAFLNKTVEVTFPLSPNKLLLLSWQREVPARASFPREQVELANAARAAHSERYLYAHLHDEKIARLAAEHKDLRPVTTTEGFGPDTFAPIEVAIRASKRKPG